MSGSGDPVARFRADFFALLPDAGARVGIACSGGPDSTALLLLAARALPGRVEAGTVDHGLRAEAAMEAALAGEAAAALGVNHATLSGAGPLAPGGNLQARARVLRYRLLGAWARERGLAAVLTAHHLDDQAETVLMRLARGAGLSGLSGIRPIRVDVDGPPVLRPLLGWRRSELAAVVAGAGLAVADDPSNHDPRHDRTRVRALLAAESRLLRPAGLTAAAAHLREADLAIEELTATAFAPAWDALGRLSLARAADHPRAIRRRLVSRAIAAVRDRHGLATPPPDADVESLLRALEASDTATLGRIKAEATGDGWRFGPVPPHRSR